MTKLIKCKNVYFSLGQFMVEVGCQTIWSLESYGIVPDRVMCGFSKERFEELKEFCKTHPEFHIISKLEDGSVVNFATEDAWAYRLGKGNSDASLIAKDPLFMKIAAQGWHSSLLSECDELKDIIDV